MLEFVEARKRPLSQRHHCFKNFLLVGPQRFQLPVVVMNNPYRAGEAQLHRPPRNLQRVFRILHAAAQHRVNVHLKHRVLR